MNEDFLARLRAAAAETPAVHVDRDRVLRSGRRRRAGRTAAVLGLAGVLLAATVTGVGALAPDAPRGPAQRPPDSSSPAPKATALPFDTPYGPVDVVAGAAEVDAEAGVIHLPFGEAFLTADEWEVVGTAQDLYLRECFDRAGYGEYYRPGEAPMLADSASRHAQEAERYGVWRAADVRDHGYAAAMAMWGPPQNTSSSGLPFSEEAAAASRGCFRDMIEAGLTYEPETATAAAPLGMPEVTGTPEGALVVGEWEQCLQDAGVASPTDDESGVLVPAGAWEASFEDQVRIGLVDVQCKDDTDLVQRLGDVEAAYQLAYLERGAAWVADFRQIQHGALAAAEAYLEQARLEGRID